MSVPVTILWLISSLLIVAIVSYIFQHYLTQVVLKLQTMMQLMSNIAPQLIMMVELLKEINAQLNAVNSQLIKRNENR